MAALIALLLLLFIVIIWLVAEVRKDLRLRHLATQPAACGRCEHETTPAVVARERCPECGAPYMLAGVDAPYPRVSRRASSSSIYGACLTSAFLASFVIAFTLSRILTKPYSYAGDWDYAAVIGFLVSFLALGALPCALVWRRRRRIQRELLAQMQPPEASFKP